VSPSVFALAAILLWSTLALAGASMQSIPPFILLGVAFCTAGLVSLVRRRGWRIPLKTLAVGVAGIFGYHFLYFRAFSLAPAIEANLINYLWPVLIVGLSPLILPAYHLRAFHLLGAGLGLAGAALIATGGRLNPQFEYLTGYLLAGGAALTWSVYSLLTKRLPSFPTESVGVFCLISGFLAFAAHYLLGGRTADLAILSISDWIKLILLGIGPMGAAFFLWDAALKRGDPRVIGSLAYLTPLLSTLNLILFAGQQLTWITALAMILIVMGAVVGSGQLKFGRYRFIIIMGVSGSGKTSIGKALAARLGWSFFDADDFHSPENISKMAAGIPLTDADRIPWLSALHDLVARYQKEHRPGILACSALKDSYREKITSGSQKVSIVYLKGDFDLLWSRMSGRKNHYMQPKMLQSQFAALEEPENALVIDIAQRPEEIVGKIIAYLKEV
jgi:carbohydrate kinase (thermoresistant glucokinase family)